MISIAVECSLKHQRDDEDNSGSEEGESFPPGKAPPEFRERGQATLDEMEEVNLGSDEEPRPLSSEFLRCVTKRRKYFEFLKQNQDVFAWTNSKMPGLDPVVALQCLTIESER